jgi:nucleotide-binding universal stress UspA family protein
VNKTRDIDRKVEVGIPSDKIVETAERGNHDLIVLGRRGMSNVKRFLIGGNSDAVAHKAKYSVLIVPAKG